MYGLRSLGAASLPQPGPEGFPPVSWASWHTASKNRQSSTGIVSPSAGWGHTAGSSSCAAWWIGDVIRRTTGASGAAISLCYAAIRARRDTASADDSWNRQCWSLIGLLLAAMTSTSGGVPRPQGFVDGVRFYHNRGRATGACRFASPATCCAKVWNHAAGVSEPYHKLRKSGPVLRASDDGHDDCPPLGARRAQPESKAVSRARARN
jgi:hypothetical protein